MGCYEEGNGVEGNTVAIIFCSMDKRYDLNNNKKRTDKTIKHYTTAHKN